MVLTIRFLLENGDRSNFCGCGRLRAAVAAVADRCHDGRMPQPHDPDLRTAGIPHWAERLVRFLDDGLQVPGTTFRVGFDALLGLIPGIGDLITTTTGLSLVYLAQQRGVPKVVLARMMMNLGIDSLFGAIPVLGDAFDIVFKANRRNLTLLQRYDRAPVEAGVRDTIFVVLVVLGALVVVMVPFVVAVLLVSAMLG
ncbi:MAG TPA: DUF4112 domain-containing protein [Terriglobales bacterium]|nr:DUF4112 domain-containing protein [Terriglobales bacterium]